MKRIINLFVLSILSTVMLFAASSEKKGVYSTSMKKEISVRFIVPDKHNPLQPCPVVYLLHGYGGHEDTWITLKPELKEWADKHHVIVVCPNGENAWYWDSPKNPNVRFETFVSKELVDYVDTNYATLKDRRFRAITGLSMGGHGAMWLSIRHQDVFGIAGSTSGGLDIRPFPNNWEMKKQLGEKAQNEAIWDAHTVINQLDKLKDGDLKLIIDCGYDDFFFDVNNQFHAELCKRGIAHDYLVRPGVHNGTYWSNSISYQLLFFVEAFAESLSCVPLV